MKQLTIDTGLREYAVNGGPEHGGGVLRFNPSDPNVYSRFCTLQNQLQELEQQVLSYTPALDKTLLFKAFQFANDAHREQKRKDGSPYITHPLAVAEIVAELELDTDSIIAALLHDCTKKLDMERQLALCAQYHIRLDDLERHALKLLHAKTGAAIARDVFGVDDAVYWAIYWHTTGHADMTLLEKIIYLADYIEPSRDFPGVEDLRQAVHADLDGGLLKALNDSIQDMRQWGNPVHHNTLDARDYLLRGKHL